MREQINNAIFGLNRTSVGLKLLVVKVLADQKTGPQSNQRGIETLSPPGRLWPLPRASIEPAWD